MTIKTDEEALAVLRVLADAADSAVYLHEGVGMSAPEDLVRYLTQRLAAVDSAEPDPALLVSMAMRLDHGFGLLDKARQDARLHDMRKLWDEVAGRGFYKSQNSARYAAMIAPAPSRQEG